MTRHKSKVGHLMNFAPPRPGVPTADSQYEIVQFLPIESGGFSTA